MLKNFNKLLPYSTTSRLILKNVENLTSQGRCSLGSNAAPKEKVAGGSTFNDENGAASSSNGPPPGNKNPLKRFLIDKIRLSGPISVAEYMQICVGSPGAGYYSKNDGQIFGARGDFVTSPEFTQMLGELMGVWAVNEFFKLSHSADWQLIELGPGSGSLMHDVLGVARKFRLTEKNMEVRLGNVSKEGKMKFSAFFDKKTGPFTFLTRDLPFLENGFKGLRCEFLEESHIFGEKC